jgi:excisionase family DNA binding protein
MDSIVLDLLKKQEKQLKSIEGLLSTSKNILNLDDLSHLTGLSKSHIYKLTASSKIPHYKQSSHLYFDRLEIEAWLKENRIKTQSEIEQEASTYVTLNKKGGAR